MWVDKRNASTLHFLLSLPAPVIVAHDAEDWACIALKYLTIRSMICRRSVAGSIRPKGGMVVPGFRLNSGPLLPLFYPRSRLMQSILSVDPVETPGRAAKNPATQATASGESGRWIN